jgi:hypothetical protein
MPSLPKDIEAIYTAVRLRLSQEGSASATTGSGPRGPKGPAGPQGPKGVTWQGVWIDERTYQKGDLVTMDTPGGAPCLGGATLTYMAIADHYSTASNFPTPGGTAEWHELTSGALILDGLRAMMCNLDMDSHEVDNVAAIDFVLTPTHEHAEGGFHWDATTGIERPVADVNGAQVVLGSVYSRVVNEDPTSIAIPSFRVVAVTSAGSADVVPVELANSDQPSSDAVLGVTLGAFDPGASGWVCRYGEVRGLDTSAYSSGTPLFLMADGELGDGPFPPRGDLNCAGARVRVGWVVTQDAVDGVFLVAPERVPFLSDLQDVDVTGHMAYSGPNLYDVLQWVEANSSDEESDNECDAWRPRPPSFFPTLKLDVTDTPYNVEPKDVFVYCDCLDGQVTVILPDPGKLNNDEDNRGRVLHIKKLDCSRSCVVIDGNGFDVEGELEQRLKRQGESVTLTSYGAEWWVS